MKIGIIADDLTGANATGVRLSKNGFHPATYFHYNDLIQDDKTDAIIVDTDSRYASKKVLDYRVGGSLNKLKKWDADILCKRIDSTLRGNVGIEIDMILETVGEDSIGVVVPSFPDSGRITVGGYLIVDNLPLHKTDAANDPITPITTSYVPEIISSQTNHKVGMLTINDMTDDRDIFTSSFKKLVDEGNKIIVLDSVTNNDIEFIAETLCGYTDKKIVPIDPGPFTSLYAKYRADQVGDDRKIIVTVGSATKVSERQLVYLIDRLKLTPVIPDINKLATFDEKWHEEVDRSVRLAKERMEENEVVVITTNEENLVIIDIKKIAAQHDVTPDRVAKRITDGLATITKRLLDESTHEIKGCYVSGGDVTASLASITLASGIKLIDEVGPLIAYGHLLGGKYEGLPLVTKGGMIGNRHTLYEAVQYLKSK